MRTAAAAVAALLALTSAPVVLGTTDSDRDNLAWMRTMHPHADAGELRSLSAMAAERGISFARPAAPDASGVAGIHGGEIWSICQDLGWWSGNEDPDCRITDLFGTTVPCAPIFHSHTYRLLVPSAVRWTAGDGGTPAFSHDYFWTEGPLLGPTVVPHRGHDFTGSGCVFQHFFSTSENYAIGIGHGVAAYGVGKAGP